MKTKMSRKDVERQIREIIVDQLNGERSDIDRIKNEEELSQRGDHPVLHEGFDSLGLVELKKKNISPAIKQFKEAVALDPSFAEARLNLAALSLNNRDYNTAEENFREALKLQPK